MTATINAEPVLTVPEVAQHLGIERQLAYRLIGSGAIRSIRLGSGRNPHIRVPESALRDFIAGQTQDAEQ